MVLLCGCTQVVHDEIRNGVPTRARRGREKFQLRASNLAGAAAIESSGEGT